jgi:hypothetical protein
MAFSEVASKSIPSSPAVGTDPEEFARKIDGLSFGDGVAVRSGTLGGGSKFNMGGLEAVALLLNLTRPFSRLAAATAAVASATCSARG